MNKISAVIITFNEEANIGRCIDSLRPVVDEIVVVDCFSTDGTKAICVEKGVRFIENEFQGFAHQKNFALSMAKHEYVLSLDADEYLSEELTTAILEVKRDFKYDGYLMNRLSSYAGEWIKSCGWYPDTKLRLWKRTKGTWIGESVHEKVHLEDGCTISRLEGDLLHHAYDNITQFLEKIQRYSDIYAREHKHKIKSSGFKIFYKTAFAFVKSFFLKHGILDGYKGLLISACNANFVFYKYAKLREANHHLTTSLIISTYNREDALELVLLSVLKQTVPPTEVIIADDGSREGTKELIDRYRLKFAVPLIHCWHEDFGFRAGQIRNKAIAMASGEYIISVDGDMVLHKDFIKMHKQAAWRGRFIQGSRVLLSAAKTDEVLKTKRTGFSVVESGIRNKINGIFSPFMSKFATLPTTRLEGTKTCNMAFWRNDFIKINGFNEDIVGWGREDTEMAVRLMNNGILRYNLKFGGFGYHLYHPENSREMLSANDRILKNTIESHLTRCTNGVLKYINGQDQEQAISQPIENQLSA
ncbi:MAG: glycosyltransferase [Cyclobacteriaceae bacterium]